MRRCAVYEYVGAYGGGLVFVPIEYDHPPRPYNPPIYKRLGEMDVDDTVLKFVKCGSTDSEWEQADFTVIT